MTEVGKIWYKSRTIWAAVLLCFAGVLTGGASYLNGTLDATALVQSSMDAVFGVVILILRTLTTEPLK